MKNPRTQLLLAGALLCLALAGYAFWYRAVARASREEQALSASVESATLANQKALESKDALSALSADQAAVGRYFLADADVVPFLEELQALGSVAGAAVDVVSVGAGSGAGATSTLAVTLHITGGFDAVARTAGAIEYAPYDLIENSLAFASDGKGAWHADMAITVGARGASASASASSSPSAPRPASPASAAAGGGAQVAPL
jgi:hypothetical protein